MRRDRNFDTTPRRSQTLEASNPDLADSDAVVAPNTPVPLSSTRLTRGLWADTQRHLIQWIEGYLDQELGFGVVEMEEGLRNGVVLAKLVRVFQGEGVVRRIYESYPVLLRSS
ncbi:hypothetical protein J3R30DRAFT_3528280 [Lentinula aciculospora]|uniref:Uncharacterized protein n=1 Tax=Lentinula aciculospora TaxID=153920 RepID=A0A9W9A107_9AGAR|nr:hypothetical protein J3R30DRAFT_3528280 [Lentinula aciculospora]